MREQIQHDRADGPSPGRSIEVHLAGILLQACDQFEEQAEAAAEHDIAEALGLKHHPGDIALADLTDRLLTRCEGLSGGVEGIRPEARGVRGNGVLETWATLKNDGPEGGPLGTWSYAKHLALTARDMIRVLRDHRTRSNADLAAYVGRTDLRPTASDAR